jgi:hypothetical protein
MPPRCQPIGLDLRKWPNSYAFCFWLGLAPHHGISGGRSCARARCIRATAWAKPSAWQSKWSVAAATAWGHSTGACGPPRPQGGHRGKRPKLRGSPITSSRSGPPSRTAAPRTTNSRPGNGTSLPSNTGGVAGVSHRRLKFMSTFAGRCPFALPQGHCGWLTSCDSQLFLHKYGHDRLYTRAEVSRPCRGRRRAHHTTTVDTPCPPAYTRAQNPSGL